MQIVVKQDQVEVSLQALQGPLPDTLLAAASLRGGDRREVGEVKMGLLWPHNPPRKGRSEASGIPEDSLPLPSHSSASWESFQASPLPPAAGHPGAGRAAVASAGTTVPMRGLPPPQALSPETGWGSPTAPAPPRGQHLLWAEAARVSASPLSQGPSPPFAWDPPYKKTKRPS